MKDMEKLIWKTVEKIPIADAFDELDTERDYYQEKQNNKNENTKLETKPKEVIKQNIEVENEPKKDVEVKRKNIRRNYVRKNVKAEIKKNDENAVVSALKPVHEKKNIKVARDRLKIIPLGGLEEVGKNMTVFEYGNEMIIVDCGVAFPEDDMLGVDLVIPDFSYLTKNREKFKAMVITHGHEDHIGAIPYVLKELNVPEYSISTYLQGFALIDGYNERF